MFFSLSTLFAYLLSEEEHIESLSSSSPTRKESLLLFLESLERKYDVVGENVSWCLWLFALVGFFFSFMKFREIFRQKLYRERVGRPSWIQKPVTASTACPDYLAACPPTQARVSTAPTDVCTDEDMVRLYRSVKDFNTRQQQPHEDYNTYAAALISLAGDAFSELGETSRKYFLYRRFVDGIIDDQIRNRVLEGQILLGNTPSIDQALRVANSLHRMRHNSSTSSHPDVSVTNNNNNTTSSPFSSFSPPFEVEQPPVYLMPVNHQSSASNSPPFVSSSSVYSSVSTSSHSQSRSHCPSVSASHQPHHQSSASSTTSPPLSSLHYEVNNRVNSVSQLRQHRGGRLLNEEELVGRMKINGLVFPFLLDTGAVVSVIPEKMYESIVRNSKGVLRLQTRLQPYPHSLQSASSPLPIVGCFRAKLQIGQTVLHQQEIVVARMSQNKCLLGRDLISLCPEYQVHFEKIKQAILHTTVGIDLSTCSSCLSGINEVNESQIANGLCRMNAPPNDTSISVEIDQTLIEKIRL